MNRKALIRGVLALVLPGALALLVVTAAGCPNGIRLSPCQNDNDCPGRDGGHAVCYDLRCVDCHYDSDCPEGTVCSGKYTCDSIDTRAPEKEKPAAEAPKTLEECAKRCKGDQACAADCRDRFK